MSAKAGRSGAFHDMLEASASIISQIARDPVPRLPQPDKTHFLAMSWNVNGLRALDGRGILEKLVCTARFCPFNYLRK